MLGSDLRIRRFTPTAERDLHLIPSDIGRSINDLKLSVDVPGLSGLVSEVIDTLAPKELEVRDQEGVWYHLRIRPYKTIDNHIQGAVLVWVDISRAKRNAGLLQDSFDLTQAIAGIVTSPIAVLDEALRIKLGNDAFYSHFKLSREQVVDRPIGRLGRPVLDMPAVHKFLAEAASGEGDSSNLTVAYHDPHITIRN